MRNEFAVRFALHIKTEYKPMTLSSEKFLGHRDYSLSNQPLCMTPIK